VREGATFQLKEYRKEAFCCCRPRVAPSASQANSKESTDQKKKKERARERERCCASCVIITVENASLAYLKR
jgi:hypothetical protein